MINVISDGCSQTRTKSPSFMVAALRRFTEVSAFVQFDLDKNLKSYTIAKYSK